MQLGVPRTVVTERPTMAPKRHHHSMHPQDGYGHSGYAAGIGHDSDQGMMHSSHSEMANCPKEVMMKPFPRPAYFMPEDQDDSLNGVNAQMKHDISQAHKALKPRKA